jgi:hypothetical protein
MQHFFAHLQMLQRRVCIQVESAGSKDLPENHQTHLLSLADDLQLFQN